MSTEMWWGFSQEHGWVMLDRSVECNKPGLKRALLFVNCSAGSVYSVPYEQWCPPSYIFAENYLKALTDTMQISGRRELEQFKNRSKEFHSLVVDAGAVIEERRFSEARAHYFEKLQLADPGLKAVTGRVRRVTHCYDCKKPLDSNASFECNACGWLVCSLCGACGCGYQGTR